MCFYPSFIELLEYMKKYNEIIVQKNKMKIVVKSQALFFISIHYIMFFFLSQCVVKFYALFFVGSGCFAPSFSPRRHFAPRLFCLRYISPPAIRSRKFRPPRHFAPETFPVFKVTVRLQNINNIILFIDLMIFKEI